MSVITFSRQFGSGGSEVAGRVAAALGWALLDNALVDAVAEQLGVTHDAVAAREERVPSLVERFASALTLGTPEYVPVVGTAMPSFEERLLDVTRRVIQKAIAEGPVVVVGRGAQSVLAERRDAIHVFCYAPRAALVERVMHREGVGQADAERLIDETNRHREQYVRRNWNRSWNAHEHYHVCVNTAWLGIDGATDVVVRLAREKFGEVESGRR
ncbi:MAG TPA: cytidylate kinase-like family protein [Gemmatimonadaceae bacterium]|nr:cytidylate kinase-like family protein [Gemmatimonadaceae bacterium]